MRSDRTAFRFVPCFLLAALAAAAAPAAGAGFEITPTVSYRSSGYDCTGSVSFTFIQAAMMKRPIASGWRQVTEPGPGEWVTIWVGSGHVWMTVAGLRFDTSALHIAGSRWTTQRRSTAGFTPVHPAGL